MSANPTRFLRRAWLAALVALLCLVVVGSLPAVQLRLVRSVVGTDGAIALGYVHAGPRGIAVRELHVETPAFGLSVERADVDFAFWSSLAHLRLDIENATLAGVDVRVTAVESEAAELPTEDVSARARFDGLKAEARLPAWLHLRALSAAGRATVKPGPRIAIEGPWELSVAAVFAGGSPAVRLTGTFDTQRDGELVASSALAVDGSADVRADSQVERVDLTAALQPSSGNAGLRGALSARFEQDAERYAFDLTGRAAVGHADAVITPEGVLEAGWQLNLTPGVVAAFARGRSVADISGSSTGQLRADLRARRTVLRSSTQLSGRGWEAFDPRLAELGEIDLGLDVDASAEPGAVAADELRAAIRSAARGDLLTVSALQRLRFGTETWLVEPERLGDPALRVELHDVPLGWLQQLVPAAHIEAGQISGALDIVRDEARTALRVTEPLKASGVALAPVGDRDVPPFDLTLTPRATLGGGELAAEIEELRLTVPSTGGTVVFRGRSSTSRTAWPNVTFDGDVTARLPLLQKLVLDLTEIHATTRLSLDFSSLTLALAAATIDADARDGRKLVAVDLEGERPLRVALPDLRVDWNAFDPQTLSLEIDRFPLAWLSPYIPEVDFRSGDVSGRFTAVARRGEGLRLETREPLVVTNLLPVYRNRVAQQVLSATVRPELRFSNTASAVLLRELHFATPNGNRLDGEITIDRPSRNDRIDVVVALDGDFSPFARRFGAQIGRLRWRQNAAFDPASERLTITNLDLTFADTAGSQFFELRSLRPFFVKADSAVVGVDDGGSREILNAKVTPLRLEGLLPNIFGFGLEGVLPEGEFFGTAEPDGRLSLAAREPLVFRDVTVRWEDAVLLDRVSMSVLYDVSYAVDGVQARSVDLKASAPDGRELLHTRSQMVAPLRNDRLLDSAQISVQGYLAPLSDQPVLASMPRFTAGTVEGTFDFVNDGESKLKFGAQLRSAATSRDGPLPDVDVRLDAQGVRGERVLVALPLRLESASGQSDLKLDGKMTRKKDGSRDFTAALSGSRVIVADVERVLDLLAPQTSPSDQAAATPTSTPTDRATAIAKLRAQRHSVPVWTDRLSGSARLDVAKIDFPSFSVDGLYGTLGLTPRRASLRDVRASVLGATLEAGAAIDFDSARPKPYSLDFRAAIAGLELQRLFKVIAPDAAPTAEGRFELETALTGAGMNPIDLGLSSLGEIRLTGENGVFRGLAAQAGTGSTAARVVGFLTFSRELKAIGRLLDGLGEIHFQRASVRLDRKQLERIELTDFSVVSPQLRLNASGRLDVAPRQPLLASPLELSAQLAARGDVAVLFDGMGLLEEKAGSTGYRALTRTIDIHGTAANPDASEFWALLDEGANNARGSFGVALRALNSRLEREAPEAH
jgi:hypothetical protein